MAKVIKSWFHTVVGLVTGMRKLLVFFAVTGIALLLMCLGKVPGIDTLTTIKEIGIAYVTANVFTKCIDMGRQWITKKKK